MCGGRGAQDEGDLLTASTKRQDEKKTCQISVSFPHIAPNVLPLLVFVHVLQAGLDDECPICLSDMAAPVITLCRHIFCRRCIHMVIARDKPSCPMCRAPLSGACRPAGLSEQCVGAVSAIGMAASY